MIVDILVLAVLLISALIAFLRGFIREVLTIAGVVGGLAAAYIGGPLLAPVMRGWFGVEEGIEPERLFGILPYDIVADALSYGAIFILVVIALSIFSHFLAEAAKSIGLGAVDRTLGFIFGLLRGIVLLGLLYLPVHLFIDEESKESWFSGSKTHFYMERVSGAIAEYLPESDVDDVDDGLNKTVNILDGVSGTRKKLEDINLLKRDDERQSDPQDTDRPDAPVGSEGYSEDFRGQMDQLFEQKTENLNE